MSESQIQAQSSEAPVYTKEMLELKLSNLKWKMDWLLRNFLVAYRNLLETRSKLNECGAISTETIAKFDNAIEELKTIIYDAVDEMIVNELKLDTDVEKYEKLFGARFAHESERQLGVALLQEGEAVKPVVICTNYKSLWYTEGERT
jgi:molecular chaperone DnaK (HSP70)